MANTFYQVTKEINGTKYVAQYGGISTAVRAVDQSYIDGSTNISIEKLATYLFEHIIVEPKNLTIDSFETFEEFNEVVNFARGVMQGEFRNKADEGAAEAKGKK